MTVAEILKAAKWIAMGFGRDGLVLDLGSGSSPHPRADVLCDRYLGSTLHRRADLTRDRPLVCADMCALPFRTKAFVFAFCRMALEHIDPINVPAALREISRVAVSGYIEIPSPIREMLMPDPAHKSFIELEGDGLVVTPKATLAPFPPVGYALGRWRQENAAWRRFVSEHDDLLTVRFWWTGSIPHRIAAPGIVPAALAASQKDVVELFSRAETSSSPGRLRPAIRALTRIAFHVARRS